MTPNDSLRRSNDARNRATMKTKNYDEWWQWKRKRNTGLWDQKTMTSKQYKHARSHSNDIESLAESERRGKKVPFLLLPNRAYLILILLLRTAQTETDATSARKTKPCWTTAVEACVRCSFVYDDLRNIPTLLEIQRWNLFYVQPQSFDIYVYAHFYVFQLPLATRLIMFMFRLCHLIFLRISLRCRFSRHLHAASIHILLHHHVHGVIL